MFRLTAWFSALVLTPYKAANQRPKRPSDRESPRSAVRSDRPKSHLFCWPLFFFFAGGSVHHLRSPNAIFNKLISEVANGHLQDVVAFVNCLFALCGFKVAADRKGVFGSRCFLRYC